MKPLPDHVLGEELWDYMKLGQELAPTDVLFVHGGIDIRSAEWGAELYKRGLAPIVAISGGIAHKDDLLSTGWDRPEAEVFADRMEELGVPRTKMILETEATNTELNFRYTLAKLHETGIEPSTAIVVQKPYMERRALATGMIFWPDIEITMTSVPLSYDEYLSDTMTEDKLLNIMVGDLQRIIEYPKRGFQVEQEIPPGVMEAYKALIQRGFTRHMLKDV